MIYHIVCPTKYRRVVISEQVDEAIKRTLAEIGEAETVVSTRAAHRKKRKKEREEQHALQEEERALEASKIRVTEFVSVGEIANLMKVTVPDVIAKCMSLGIMVSINQRLDKDTIILLADEFGAQAKKLNPKSKLRNDKKNCDAYDNSQSSRQTENLLTPVQLSHGIRREWERQRHKEPTNPMFRFRIPMKK